MIIIIIVVIVIYPRSMHIRTCTKKAQEQLIQMVGLNPRIMFISTTTKRGMGSEVPDESLQKWTCCPFLLWLLSSRAFHVHPRSSTYGQLLGGSNPHSQEKIYLKKKHEESQQSNISPREFLSLWWFGEVGVSSQGMWAKSLKQTHCCFCIFSLRALTWRQEIRLITVPHRL